MRLVIMNDTYCNSPPLAPIVLFVYNRLSHTKKTIESLQKNKLAIDSNLFIYSDHAKNKDSEQKVQKVRDYIGGVNGFKSVTIICREKNLGLADSIIDGVTSVVNRYGKIIVLEDDIVTSPFFLKFMNDALDFYQENNTVWHISGWNYPINQDKIEDVFLWRLMNCWGWATWKKEWSFFEKDPYFLIKNFKKTDIHKFNLDGAENFWNQVLQNKKGEINSWAVFWYATIYINKGLCLNPSKTFSLNIGHDGSGVHCDSNSYFDDSLSLEDEVNLNCENIENEIALKRIQDFYKNNKKNIFIRAVNKAFRFVFGVNIIN
jgi:hypothetical protein